MEEDQLLALPSEDQVEDTGPLLIGEEEESVIEDPLLTLPVDGTRAPSLPRSKRVAYLTSMAMERYGATVDDVRTLANQITEDIAMGREHSVRGRVSDMKRSNVINNFDVDAAAEDINERLKDLASFIDNPSEDEFAVEEGGVEHLQNLGLTNKTQAEIAEDMGLGEAVRDREVKTAILQNKLDELDAKHKGQGIFRKIGNWIGVMVPMNKLVYDLGMDPIRDSGMGELGDGDAGLLNFGARIANKQEALYDLPIEEFTKVVNKYSEWMEQGIAGIGDNPLLARGAIENLISYSGLNNASYNTWAAVDIADVATGVVGAVGKAVKTVRASKALETAAKLNHLENVAENPLYATKVVNPDLAKDTAVDAVLAAQNGMAPQAADIVKTTDALDLLLPRYLSNRVDPSVGLSGDMLREIDATRAAIAETMQKSMTNQRLTPEELTEAFETAKESLRKRYIPGEIKDIALVGRDEISGMNKMELLLGKANGAGGFKSSDSAVRSANVRGMINFDTVQDQSGSWFIRQTHDIPEEGFKKPYTADNIKVSWFNSRISSFINPHSFITKELGADAILASGRKAALTKMVNEKIVPDIARLRKGEAADLGLVIDKGMEHVWKDAAGVERTGKWFTKKELDQQYLRAFKRLPSDKETKAYFAMRNLNDFDYIVRNNKEYTKRARTGMSAVDVEKIQYSGNGKVITDFKNLERERILNVTDDLYYQPGDVSMENLSDFTSKGYQLVRLETPVMKGKDPVLFVLAKRGDVKTGPLNPIQLPYKEGGHRLYAPNQHFVKQQFIGKYESGGEYVLDPVVHTASGSIKELTGWVTRHESARLAVLEYKAIQAGTRAGDLTAARKVMDDALEDINVNDIDHWNELVDNFQLREDTPFEITADGDRPMYGLTNEVYDLGNNDAHADDISRWISHRNRAYTGKRGNRLIGPDEELVRVLDPFETANKAIRNAIETGSYSDYRTNAIEQWVSSAKVSGAIDSTTSQSYDDIFFNPKYKERINGKFRDRLEAQRKTIVTQLRSRTSEDLAKDYWTKDLARFVEAKTGIDADKTLNLLNKDLVQGARSLAYDMYLGMYNVAQPLLQVQTSLAAISVNPIHGAVAARRFPAMRYAWNMTDDAIEAFAKKHPELTGMEPEDFTLMMKSFKDSGFASVSENMLNLGDTSPTVNSAVKTVNKVRRGGRALLVESEKVNVGIAYQIAWRKMKEALPNVSPTSKEGRAFLADETSKLSMDMNQSARSQLQEGALALPAQFAQYAIHMTQNIFAKNSRFTMAERMRLLIGQVAMYGGSAVPFGNEFAEHIAEQYKEATGKDMDGAWYRAFRNGMFDALTYEISGGELDTTFGTRAGTGGWVERMKEMWTDHTALELIGGAGSPAFSGLFGAIWENMSFMGKAVSEGALTPEQTKIAFQDIAREFSAYSTAEKAYLMYTKGFGLSKNGTFSGRNNEMEAVATLLGVPLRSQTDSSYMFRWLDAADQDITYDAKKVVEWSMRASTTDNPKVRDAYANMINTYIMATNPQHRPALMQEIQRRTPNDFYMNLASKIKQMDPDQPVARQPMIRQQKRDEEQ